MKKNLFYLSCTVLLVIVGICLYFLISVKNDENLPPIRSCSDGIDSSGFIFQFKNIVDTNFEEKFPYQAYYLKERYNCLPTVKFDLNFLEKKYTTLQIQKFMYHLYTDSLSAFLHDKFNQYKPDEYIKLFQWAEGFKYISIYDESKQNFYSSVSLYWMTYISHKLRDFSQEDNSLKYSFKFRYLRARCEEQGFAPPIQVSRVEKFVDNLLSNKYFHLFYSSWNQASKIEIFIFFFFSIVTFCSWIYFAMFIFKKIVYKK